MSQLEGNAETLRDFGPDHQGLPTDGAPEQDAANPSRQPEKATERQERSERSGCVLMGPSQAGKTTLIYAMDQACSTADGLRSQCLLEFVGGENVKKMSDLPIRTIMEPNTAIDPTDRPIRYEAFITATEDRGFWRPSHETTDHLVIRDGPGGALFPSPKDREHFRDKDLADWERTLLDESRQAATLILCIDANDPRSDQVSIYLRNILAALAEDYWPPLKQPFGYRLLRRLGLASGSPSPERRHRLPTDRFLLLFTKIDQLVARPLSSVGASALARFPERATPASIAKRLSPLQVAYQCIGEVNLLRILSSLRPDAEFAVGLTSAWGFDSESGQSFMKGDEPVRLSIQSRQERVLAWRPFGVREALLFMVTGYVEGPIQRIQREDITPKSGLRPLDVAVDPPESPALKGEAS